MTDPPIHKLWNGFNPSENAMDKRLLYEVTGRRLEESDFRGDETSSDEDGDKTGKKYNIDEFTNFMDKLVSDEREPADSVMYVPQVDDEDEEDQNSPLVQSNPINSSYESPSLLSGQWLLFT